MIRTAAIKALRELAPRRKMTEVRGTYQIKVEGRYYLLFTSAFDGKTYLHVTGYKDDILISKIAAIEKREDGVVVRIRRGPLEIFFPWEEEAV